MEEFQIYIDESGNSGHDLFDSNQPYFWVGALAVPKIKAEKIKDKMESLLTKLDVGELHGNELGLRKVNDISKELISIYEELDSKFIFVRVHKPHISTMKFVDSLIDSAHNPAIPNEYYSIRSMRLILAYHIASFFGEEAQKYFWEIYKGYKIDEFQEFLKELKEMTLFYIEDQRLKELLNDALDYAIKFPKEILDESDDRYESPNLVSFSLLLQGLKDVLNSKKSNIIKVIHDEQNEFAEYLEVMFETLKNFSIEQEILNYPKIEKVEFINTDIDFESSQKHYGLQLIDLSMWVLKQELDNDKKIYGDALSLIDYLKHNSYIYHFSYEALTRDAIDAEKALLDKELSEEELEQGEEILRKLEKVRKKKLSESHFQDD